MVNLTTSFEPQLNEDSNDVNFRVESNNEDKLVELMFQDKKVVDGKLNLILAKGIGKAFIARDVDPNLIKDVINNSLAI